MTVHVIVNPNAGALARDGRLRRAILAAAARGGARVHQTTSPADLDGLAREMASTGARAVILAGGDGSHMAALSSLARAFPELPAVGLAPCGTVSTVAKNFGARLSIAWTERLILAACARTARIEPNATLRVHDDDAVSRVGFIFGAGLVARFFELYYAGSRQGRVAAAGIAARVFAGSFFDSVLAKKVLAPTRCVVSVDGSPHVCEAWTLLLAAVVRDVGLHFLATYRAGETRQGFHVVASGLPPRRLGPQMPRVLAGKPLRGEPGIDVIARTLDLRFAPKPDGYVLDGEVFTTRAVRVELGPPIRLLLP